MMETDGIASVQLETHDLGASIAFHRALGFTVEFERDGTAALLRARTGPYVLLATVPATHEPTMRIMVQLADVADYAPDDALGATASFRPTHWETQELELCDPDGRTWTLEAPAAGTGSIIRC